VRVGKGEIFIAVDGQGLAGRPGAVVHGPDKISVGVGVGDGSGGREDGSFGRAEGAFLSPKYLLLRCTVRQDPEVLSFECGPR
jgi:hypothetical protein